MQGRGSPWSTRNVSRKGARGKSSYRKGASNFSSFNNQLFNQIGYMLVKTSLFWSSITEALFCLQRLSEMQNHKSLGNEASHNDQEEREHHQSEMRVLSDIKFSFWFYSPRKFINFELYSCILSCALQKLMELKDDFSNIQEGFVKVS